MKQNQEKPVAGSRPFSRCPLIEIAGTKRVLIENHQGITEYGPCKIAVKVTYGQACIFGSNLSIAHMTLEQIVICGRIDDVRIMRRDADVRIV